MAPLLDADLLGDTVPRIFTPPLRELTPETSLGFECADFLEQVVGLYLFPWQRWLLIHMLELAPGPDLRFRFRTVVILVARQNGKTTIAKGIALYFMYVLAVAMVIGTAQNLDLSEETWEATLELAQSVEELAAEIPARGGVSRVNGKKSFRLRTGERYKVAAASRRGGRGFTGNLIVMDELREHQNWESWSSVTKTTMAVAVAMVLALSNAGDAASVVLRHLRKIALTDLADAGNAAALAEIDDPSVRLAPAPTADADVDESATADDSLGLFEWSAPPGCGVYDRAGWAAANPSLGHNPGFTAANLRSAAKSDPEWKFRCECLCQWRPTAAGGPFPDGAWEEGLDESSAPSPESRVALCIDTAADGGMTYIGAAAWRPDGDVHFEVIERRAGTEWVLPWLTAPERASRPLWGAVTWQLNGAPVSQLTDVLRGSDLPVMEWAGPDLARAHGAAYELVRLPEPGEQKRRVFHREAPVLDVPASTALTRPLGDGWVVDRRKSPTDASPLVTMIGAVWALQRMPVETRSAYEDNDLLIV